MSASDYLLLSAAFTGVVVALGLAAGKPRKQQKEPGAEATRWKRFRIACGLLHMAVTEPSPLVVEEPSGLKLFVAPTFSASPTRVRLMSSQGRAQVDIARGRLFSRGKYRVRVLGKPWLSLKAPKAGEKRPSLRFVSSSSALEVGGNPSGREYEIRKKGKLVASVSWQKPGGDEAPKKEYFLEALKTEEPLPLLALVVALEVVLGAPNN